MFNRQLTGINGEPKSISGVVFNGNLMAINGEPKTVAEQRNYMSNYMIIIC